MGQFDDDYIRMFMDIGFYHTRTIDSSTYNQGYTYTEGSYTYYYMYGMLELCQHYDESLGYYSYAVNNVLRPDDVLYIGISNNDLNRGYLLENFFKYFGNLLRDKRINSIIDG